MKSKTYLFVGLGIIIVILIVSYLTQPNEEDFVQWLENNYNISCEDENCQVLILISTGEKYVSSDSYYSPFSGFLGMSMQTKRHYKKYDTNGSQFFSIEVRGFFGNFEVLEFQKNNTNISRN